jgi:hypothetical protein
LHLGRLPDIGVRLHFGEQTRKPIFEIKRTEIVELDAHLGGLKHTRHRHIERLRLRRLQRAKTFLGQAWIAKSVARGVHRAVLIDPEQSMVKLARHLEE